MVLGRSKANTKSPTYFAFALARAEASTGSDWNRLISLIVSTIALSVTAFRTAAPAENLDIYLSVPTDERAP